ncbi:hypothetical protein N0V83_000451 [Neocucurbitaria cava]|uniref:Uncharacterized protein n=1 Tax=Neocucurbitaria cava TaxID=798079 RepID=A0A9W8YGN3_9PLEO|nr:hypothetical protein N0V83_000451 [Neocucurbitaria cava]
MRYTHGIRALELTDEHYDNELSDHEHMVDKGAQKPKNVIEDRREVENTYDPKSDWETKDITSGGSVSKTEDTAVPAQGQDQQQLNRQQSDDALEEDERSKKQGRRVYEAEIEHGRAQDVRGSNIDTEVNQLPSSGHDGYRTSLHDLQVVPLSLVWPTASFARGSQISLPLSGTSSLATLDPSQRERLPLGASLERLMLRPETIALPDRTDNLSEHTDLDDWDRDSSSKPQDQQDRKARRPEGARNDLENPILGWTMLSGIEPKKGKARKKGGAQRAPPSPPVAPEVEAYRANVNGRNLRNKDTPQIRSVDEWVAQTSDPSAVPTSRAPASSLLPSVPESGPVPPPPLPNASSSALPPPSAPPPPPLALPSERDQSRATGAKPQTSEADLTPAALRRRATKSDMEIPSDQEYGGKPNISNKTPPDRNRVHASPLGPMPNVPPPPPPPVDDSLITETHGPFVPYHPIKARQSSSAKIGNTFTARHIRAYIHSLQVPTSTLQEFEYHLLLPNKGKETEHDPFRALFRVIHDDTHSLVDIIRISQQRIREGTMDEDLMQKRVTFWRSLLHRLNFNLAEVEQRLRAFVHFAYDSETHPFTFDQRTELLSEKLAKETRQTLRSCIDLLDKSSNSLLAEMQIVDSRRSIAEAESVSKLTELAFVFIPLSFVASLFSMQIHELDEGVSLYLFVVVAIAFVLVAYVVRLSIRSSRLLEYKSKMLLQIRDDSHIQYNQSIPTHTFLRWVGKAMGGTASKYFKDVFAVCAPLILLLAIFAAILSPIVLLWLRNISKGFTAMMTVLLLLLDMVLVYPVIVSASGTFQLNPMAIVRQIQRDHEISRKRKQKAKKRRKEKAGIDPESLDVESSDESDKDSKRASVSVE